MTVVGNSKAEPVNLPWNTESSLDRGRDRNENRSRGSQAEAFGGPRASPEPPPVVSI